MVSQLSNRDLTEMLYAQNRAARGSLWSYTVALEYWHQFGEDPTGVTTEGEELAGNGWTVTGAPPYVEGSAADFLDSSDKGTTGGLHLNTAEDVIACPAIFGDYAHAAAVSLLVGKLNGAGTPDLPRFLIADFGARFSANAAETGSGIGFVEDGGSPAVANDHLACIFTDGTSWKLRSGAATSSAIATDDTSWHHFRIILDRVNDLAYGMVDTLNLANAQTIAIENDQFPVGWGGGVVAGGTNDPVISWVRIRYAWHGWF